MDDAVSSLPGIGAMATARLAQLGIQTVAELEQHLQALNHTQIRQFIERIAQNPRKKECIEGYSPRFYNKRIVDGLYDFVREHVDPGFILPEAYTYRATVPDHAVLHCPTGDYGQYHSYNGSAPSADTIQRHGSLAPGAVSSVRPPHSVLTAKISSQMSVVLVARRLATDSVPPSSISTRMTISR